ncbi:MAG: trypsin-like peptidase domain-containing protein [Myxococcales bacterium]|nr:trypsin-like peptidase domain-containing protein [Myxococcales bacterium]
MVGIVAGRTTGGRFQAERTGTGIVWDASGHIVTSDHLVADADEVRVRSVGGKVFRARLVGDDGPTDVALLQIPPELPPVARGRSTALKPGHWVAAIGNPYGMDHSITVGVVSALGRRDLPPGGPRYGDFIQADLNVNPGNSGGPLVNDAGEVVGITTAMIGGARGLAFASPIEMVETVVGRLQRDGRFVRGFAGLFVKPMTWAAARDAGLDQVVGARVRGVVAGGPAALAGIVPGDIILRFREMVVDDDGALPWLVAAAIPGSRVPVDIIRGTDRMTLELLVTEAR